MMFKKVVFECFNKKAYSMIYISESLYTSCNESIYTLIYSKYKI